MRNRGEKGSVTLFIVGVCLFIMIMIMAFIVNIENKKQAQNREINKITKSYEQTEEKMEEIYQRTVNENQ